MTRKVSHVAGFPDFGNVAASTAASFVSVEPLHQEIGAKSALADMRIIAGAALVSVAERSWMKVLPAGFFAARDGRGPFRVGTLADMRAIVDRTLKHAARTELMVDYDHQAKTAPSVGGRAEAAGWVKALEARPDGIWAEVEWTAAARTKIRAGEYRYLSPLFASDGKGNVALLLNIALVNMPAIDLEAIAAGFNLNMSKELTC